MATPLAAQALINGIIFGVYSESYRRLQHVPYTVFWAGCVSGMAQSFVAGPVELAKICMQVQGEGVDPKKMTIAQKQKLRYTGSIDCLWKIFRTEGFGGISKGMCVTIVRETPACGLYFYTYDELCKLGPRSSTKDEASPVTVLTAGGIAGVISWIVTYPTDVIKSRFQADLDGKYRNSIDCAIKSYRAEGWRMFFQGMNSTIIRAFPTNAVTFGTVVLFARLVYGDDEQSPW